MMLHHLSKDEKKGKLNVVQGGGTKEVVGKKKKNVSKKNLEKEMKDGKKIEKVCFELKAPFVCCLVGTLPTSYATTLV